ncbi:MAG: NfeD family protein [Bacteroidota bacterium]
MASIIILILLGILLFIIEFFLIPGVTIAGIGGFILTVFGVYKAFADFGPNTGILVLAITLVISVIVIIFALRARTWKRLMLNTDIHSKVDENLTEEQVKPGDTGITITRLAPMGKVEVNGVVTEGKSVEGYISEHVKIEVLEIEGSRLIVKPVN